MRDPMRGPGRMSMALLLLLVACGCVNHMKTSVVQQPRMLDSFPQIRLRQDNIDVSATSKAASYQNYQADVFAMLVKDSKGKVGSDNPSAPLLEVALTCTPQAVSEITEATLDFVSPFFLMPFSQHSNVPYSLRYRVLDSNRVEILKGNIDSCVEGSSLGWFLGKDEDGNVSVLDRVKGLLARQGRLVSQNAARLLLSELCARQDQISAAIGQPSLSPALAAGPDEKPKTGAKTDLAPVAAPVSPATPPPRRRGFAIVIGIDKYAHFPPLRNAVSDARQVASVLREQYGFQTRELLDETATLVKIMQVFRSVISELREGDNVIVFYSGHGWMDDLLKEGYWIPVDASEPSGFFSNADLHKVIEAMEKAQHVFMVADSCFAGKFLDRSVDLRAIGIRPADGKEKPDVVSQFLRKMDNRKSRIVLTSGSNEPVPDGGREGHSIFSYYFLRSLQYPDENAFGAVEVSNRVQRAVGNNALQTPLLGFLKAAGHEEGQMVFVKTEKPQ